MRIRDNYVSARDERNSIPDGDKDAYCLLASEPISLLYLQQLSVVQGKKFVVSSTVSITTLISVTSSPRLIAVFDGAGLIPFV